MSERYKVSDRSESGHCCFAATVIDTSRPQINGDGEPTDQFEEVCECFEISEAHKVAAVMNASEFAGEGDASARSQIAQLRQEISDLYRRVFALEGKTPQ